jgi:hypothetical protein
MLHEILLNLLGYLLIALITVIALTGLTAVAIGGGVAVGESTATVFARVGRLHTDNQCDQKKEY